MMPHPEWNLQEVEYDANGNLLHMQQGLTSATKQYQYTPGTNQLKGLQHPSKFEAYEHNANGWITKSGEINAVHYDPQTALPVDIRARKGRILLLYGGHRQRVVKTTITAPQEQRVYVHGANAYPLVEYTQKGRTCYIYGPGGLLAQSEDAQTFAFFLKDHLGSTRVVLNEENQPLATFRYLPFGSVIPDNSNSREALHRFRYLFTGQEYDEETGLHNYRARLYDSDLGRFLTPDPKRQLPSPYVYVNNNPLNFTDPTGELFVVPRLMGRGRTLTRGGRRAISQKLLQGGKEKIPVFDTLQEMRDKGYLGRLRFSTLYRGIRDEAVMYTPQVGREFRQLSIEEMLKLKEGTFIDDIAAFKQHSRGAAHPQAVSSSLSLTAALAETYTGEAGALLIIKAPEEVGTILGKYAIAKAGSDLDEYPFKYIVNPERVLAIVTPSAVKELKVFLNATRPKTSVLERYSHLVS
jgi:RHS repeat-associated protein